MAVSYERGTPVQVVIFLQDAERHWLLRHTWVLDANLGMLKRQVECSHQRIGDTIFIFPHI